MLRKIRERTLYDYICRLFADRGWKCQSQVGVEGKEPDLILEYMDSMIVSEVKIDSEIKLTDAIVDASTKARSLNVVNAMALLFSKDVRQIPPTELEKVHPNLEVTALILTEWMSDRQTLTLSNLAELLTGSYKEWLRAKTARVNYDLVVDVARDAIREVASYLRFHLTKKPVLDSAMGVIGRFDVYKSLLEDFSGATEEEAKLYVADIAAYILMNQLLFYQIIAEKLGFDKLPDVNPITPPEDFLSVLDKQFEQARKMYTHILGLNLFPLLEQTSDKRIVRSVARIVSTLKALRPERIREDLFGRLYHETIPPETRKNLGAFYTKPEAAKLLAVLAIDKWEAKVLDPACGSGTLLVEAYQRKAQLAPPEYSGILHTKFIEEDIFGIDIMHFAAHMTSTNLTSQNLQTHAFPNVSPGDGIEKMIKALEGGPDDPLVEQQPITKWLEAMPEVIIPKALDAVIMNPPFTRRERIPGDIKTLGEMVPEVKGKTGYWAYFIIPADKLLNKNGVMAVVIPEEFFVGGSARSVREYIFDRGYKIQHIVRSAVEVGFSEAAHYRDYLIVLRKGPSNPLVVTILKRPLSEIRNSIEKLAMRIEEFAVSMDSYLSLDELDSLKIFHSKELVEKHIDNLKPLVGFNTIKAHELALLLLDEMKDNPTLLDLENKGTVRIRVYNPGQYKIKGVEDYSRKLFASKYGARGPTVTFLVDKIEDRRVHLSVRRGRLSAILPIAATIPSLRTYSGVRHMDLTNEEEVAIVELQALPEVVRKITGLEPFEKANEGAYDIKSGYDDLTGNFLLARKIRLTSEQLFWMALYCENNVLGTTSAYLNMHVGDKDKGKALIIYLNSTLTLIQLVSFMAEVEGAYVTLHGDQVWAHIYVPEITSLSHEKITKALDLFSRIHKSNVGSIFERIKQHHEIQRSIDEIALEMIGLEDWKSRLDEVYDAVTNELETMHKILETSRRPPKRRK